MDEQQPKRGRDRLLDTIKAVAIVRVVLWHTWSWAWLSWIPAMPAMFFANGALLDRSLARQGWRAMLGQRLRRLLIPFWVYAACCWLAMIATGWRPGPWDPLRWLVPLADPVGSPDLPGLWIPLWYVRAYLWFVLISAGLKRLEQRWGMWSVLAGAALTVVIWALIHAGVAVPLALGDAAAYVPFVLAGMVYHARGRIGGSRILTLLGSGCAVSAFVVLRRYGPSDAVVNRSYLLMLLVGGAGIMWAAAAAPRILAALDRSSRAVRIVDRINSRALTIYLWQGFGLVAADRLVAPRIHQVVVAAVASLLVVGCVVWAAAIVVGPIEDVAARRITARGLWPELRLKLGSRTPSGLRRSVTGAAVVVLVAAFAIPAPGNHVATAPLSGDAVVARAGEVGESLRGSGPDPAPDVASVGVPAQAVLDGWLDANRDALADLDLRSVEVVVADATGEIETARWGAAFEEPLLWWSMTKTVTVAWLMRLVESGAVTLDDPLAKWVPEVPNARIITLEQLARHTSGIPGDLDSHIFDSNPVKDIARYKESGKLRARPGESFSYSRIGYLLLGLALERASGLTWTAAVSDMAQQAHARIGFDEDLFPNDSVTDPDGHGYRGDLWSSGGLVSEPIEAVRLLQWIFTKGLAPSSVDAMTRFSADPDHWYYGLGLMPLCPCDEANGYISAQRFGLDSATGSFAVDRSGTVVLVRPSNWFRGREPVSEFYELERQLLTSAATPDRN